MVQAIRKIILFILAIAMPVGGLIVLGQEFIWGHGFRKSLAMGSFLIWIGIYVLWADFIEPIIAEGRRRAALKRFSLSVRSRGTPRGAKRGQANSASACGPGGASTARASRFRR
jgi:hypothetical protein